MSGYAPSRPESPEDAAREAQITAWLDAGPVAVVVLHQGRPRRATITARRDGVTYAGARYRRRFYCVYERPGSKAGWSKPELLAITEVLAAAPRSTQHGRAA
jgi:hypothetical protein